MPTYSNNSPTFAGGTAAFWDTTTTPLTIYSGFGNKHFIRFAGADGVLAATALESATLTISNVPLMSNPQTLSVRGDVTGDDQPLPNNYSTASSRTLTTSSFSAAMQSQTDLVFDVTTIVDEMRTSIDGSAAAFVLTNDSNLGSLSGLIVTLNVTYSLGDANTISRAAPVIEIAATISDVAASREISRSAPVTSIEATVASTTATTSVRRAAPVTSIEATVASPLPTTSVRRAAPVPEVSAEVSEVDVDITIQRAAPVIEVALNLNDVTASTSVRRAAPVTSINATTATVTPTTSVRRAASVTSINATVAGVTPTTSIKKTAPVTSISAAVGRGAVVPPWNVVTATAGQLLQVGS